MRAARFRALGDPTRLRIVLALLDGTRCVCELREEVGVAGPLLSHHLAVLRQAGLVAAVRRGRWVDYSVTPDARSMVRWSNDQPAGALPKAAVL